MTRHKWCRTYKFEMGTADTLQASRAPNATQGYADNSSIEVMHYFEAAEEEWRARWLMHTPGSGVWFNLGKTLIVETHAALNAVWGLNCPCTLFGFDNCLRKQKACHSDECPSVARLAIHHARADGYDSVQILRHWMDGNCDGLPKYEIIDLREPYVPEPPEGTVMNGYYDRNGSPCIKMRLGYRFCELSYNSRGRETQWLACRK